MRLLTRLAQVPRRSPMKRLKQILNSTRSGTGSHCRTSRRSDVMWSDFFRLHSSLAAALRTDCRKSAIVIVIVISKLLKRYSKAKRTRAPAYSRALRRIKGGFPKGGQEKLRSEFQSTRRGQSSC